MEITKYKYEPFDVGDKKPWYVIKKRGLFWGWNFVWDFSIPNHVYYLIFRNEQDAQEKVKQLNQLT
jgi:hypothetical protein